LIFCLRVLLEGSWSVFALFESTILINFVVFFAFSFDSPIASALQKLANEGRQLAVKRDEMAQGALLENAAHARTVAAAYNDRATDRIAAYSTAKKTIAATVNLVQAESLDDATVMTATLPKQQQVPPRTFSLHGDDAAAGED